MSNATFNPTAQSLREAGMYDIRQAGYARRMEARREHQAGASSGNYAPPFAEDSPEARAWRLGADAASKVLLESARVEPVATDGHAAVIDLETAEQVGGTYRVFALAQDAAVELNRPHREAQTTETAG